MVNEQYEFKVVVDTIPDFCIILIAKDEREVSYDNKVKLFCDWKSLLLYWNVLSDAEKESSNK